VWSFISKLEGEGVGAAAGEQLTLLASLVKEG